MDEEIVPPSIVAVSARFLLIIIKNKDFRDM